MVRAEAREDDPFTAWKEDLRLAVGLLDSQRSALGLAKKAETPSSDTSALLLPESWKLACRRTLRLQS